MGNYYSAEVALTPATKKLWDARLHIITYPHELRLGVCEADKLYRVIPNNCIDFPSKKGF